MAQIIHHRPPVKEHRFDKVKRKIKKINPFSIKQLPVAEEVVE